MLRTAAIVVLMTAMLAMMPASWAGPASTPPPVTYEVQINGENFSIEANRTVKVESKKTPGASYQVAVRVAPTQQVRLNTVQFDYELPAKVEDNGKQQNRSARLTHELGFSILLCDLGQPFEPQAQEATLKVLIDSVAAALREEKVSGIDTSPPHQRTFDGSNARGATIRYRDGSGIGHVDLLYVLTGPTFAATCVVGYLDSDSEDVLPLVKKTLDSVRAISGRR